MTEEVLKQRQQQVTFDKKWIVFLRRTWLFRYIPFVEFALAAGSMATGAVRAESDFDVIVGARYGRIFTARLFAVLAFGLFGWRRTKLDHKEAAKDKVCLNHFVTEKSYKLSPPYNDYWKSLYMSLVPVYGTPAAVNYFWRANYDWLGNPRTQRAELSSHDGKARLYQDDMRHKYRSPSALKRLLESLLGGAVGNWLESWLRTIQIKRIERGLAAQAGYKPRIIYSDAELEFHPDTRRIEELTK